MDEVESLMDLLLVDIIAVSAVVGAYLIYIKARSFFRGFKRLRTEHYLRSTLNWPGLADWLYGSSSRRHGVAPSHGLAYWIAYALRKGISKAWRRFSLEKRVCAFLKKQPKAELDKIAFSVMFWSRKDCPNEELYLARPPHHVSLREEPFMHNPRTAEERSQRMLTIKSRSEKEVLAGVMAELERRSTHSLQWVHDCLKAGWVDEIGRTKSRAIKLTRENQLTKAG